MKIYFIYFIFLLLGGLVFFAGCLEEGNPDNGAVSFLVEVQSSAFGTKEQPLSFPGQNSPVEVELIITPRDSNLQPINFTGNLEISVHPGMMEEFQALEPADVKSEVLEVYRFVRGQKRLTTKVARLEMQGQKLRAKVKLINCFGPTSIWVEDMGNNSTAYIFGVSDKLFHFEAPGIQDIQRITTRMGVSGPFSTRRSSLEGYSVGMQRVETPTGQVRNDMVLTAVVNEGFFVTDLAKSDFNSIFIYNFSYPEGLWPGVKLRRLSGIVAEFNGSTNLNFPTWQVLYQGGKAMTVNWTNIPVITIAHDDMEPDWRNNLKGLTIKEYLEGVESSRVEAVDLLMPDNFMDCDFNKNGEVEYNFEYGEGMTGKQRRDSKCTTGRNQNAEECCLDDCYEKKGCSEKLSYFKYRQFSAEVLPWVKDTAQNKEMPRKILINLAEACPDFELMHIESKEQKGQGKIVIKGQEGRGKINHVRGNLVNVQLAQPKWLIRVSRPGDITIPGITCGQGN